MSNDRFDEYKLFVESTQHLSERRQAATKIYLTVNTAIFAILALRVKEAGLKGWYLVGGQPSTLSRGRSGLPDFGTT